MGWILGRVGKVCGPRTYLVKTRCFRADHDKGPNEASEIEILVPELCDQSVPVPDTESVSNDVLQSTNKESEPTPCKESSPVILRRSLRNRKQVDRLNVSLGCCLCFCSVVFVSLLWGEVG